MSTFDGGGTPAGFDGGYFYDDAGQPIPVKTVVVQPRSTTVVVQPRSLVVTVQPR